MAKPIFSLTLARSFVAVRLSLKAPVHLSGDYGPRQSAETFDLSHSPTMLDESARTCGTKKTEKERERGRERERERERERNGNTRISHPRRWSRMKLAIQITRARAWNPN